MTTTRFQIGAPVVRASQPAYAGGKYGETNRKGVASFSTLIQAAMPYRYSEQNRILTNTELWQVYGQCPDVRAAIDATCMRVSTWDWDVEPVVDPSDDRYEMAKDIGASVKKFLSAPNTNGETWQEWNSKLMRDVLVFDALCTEHVLDGKGKLQELVALRGGDVTPIEDTKQRLLGFKQINPVGQQVDFEPEQVTYLNLFPNTTAPGGKPLIETLVSEIITLMRQAKHLMLAYDADEVMPGILLLGGLSGKAAERAISSFKEMKGSDQKLRVLTTDSPGGVQGNWIELRHTPKDLQMRELVHEVRRVVWRIFHVKPVTMGDTDSTPRATAEVQVEAEEEGLIIPFLEVWEQKINQKIIPLIVGDPEMAALVSFKYDRKKKLSATEQKAEAEADGADMERGALTINERRHRRGLLPVEGGDIPMVKTSVGWSPLSALSAPAVPAAVDGAAADGVSDPEAGKPSTDDSAPGDVAASKARIGVTSYKLPTNERKITRWVELQPHNGCRCEPEVSFRGVRAASLLPSEWQSGGKFKDHRTVDLKALGDAVIGYHREVGPLYRQARTDCAASVRAYLSDDKISVDELPHVIGKVRSRLEQLHSDWSSSTDNFYRQSARLGREAATDWTGDATAASDWRETGSQYHQQAMAWLVADRGLIRDVTDQIQSLLIAEARSKIVTRDLESVLEGMDTAQILGALRAIFDANEHRISNWSGKLIELASSVLTKGLETHGGDQWHYEWVDVSDSSECPDCKIQGARGFQPLSAMTTKPGGAVRCGGRCRCVVVFWTEAEVKSGKAVSLRSKGPRR